ncbi:MAG: MFS transporter [Sphaerochaetaceae bacterium]|nr:MFS transporter [Sphaerochaetaceae bacterium]MDC7237603.1 MFS transporter [Sphaerochaetaceae bacterium]
MNKIIKDKPKTYVSWALYDWANSAFATTVMAGFFPVFFSEYWTQGAKASTTTFYLGLGNSLASLIVAILAPILGAIADHGNYKKRFLITFAFLGCLMSGNLSLVHAGYWQLAIIFYITACIGFSGANTFYDSLLPSVASENKVDYVSSLGYSLGYIGGGLLFLINVTMYLKPEWFNLADGVAAIKASFITVGVWWFVFTIPLILFVKEEKNNKDVKVKKSIKVGLIEFKTTVKDLKHLPTLLTFLVAYWFYIDGVDTIVRMAVDFGTSLGFSSSSLIVALLLTQFVAFPSALLYSLFGKKIGIKKALFVAIIAYTIIAGFGALMTKEFHFYLLASAIGLFQGGIQALSRSFYTRLIPENKHAEFFGFFNMLGKFAAILGPLLLGLVTLITDNNRYGIISLILLFVIGAILLSKVDLENNDKEIKNFLAAKEKQLNI